LEAVKGTSLARTSGKELLFSTVLWLDEAMVRAYIKNQKMEGERYDQVRLGV